MKDSLERLKELLKNKKMFGKYGLKGKSGSVREYIKDQKDGIGHVSANYDCNGMVFVEWKMRGGTTWWKRMTLKRAKKEKRRIIKCDQCPKPAVSLDHLWPYHSDYTSCAEHYAERNRR